MRVHVCLEPKQKKEMEKWLTAIAFGWLCFVADQMIDRLVESLPDQTRARRRTHTRSRMGRRFCPLSLRGGVVGQGFDKHQSPTDQNLSINSIVQLPIDRSSHMHRFRSVHGSIPKARHAQKAGRAETDFQFGA